MGEGLDERLKNWKRLEIVFDIEGVDFTTMVVAELCEADIDGIT